MRGRAGACFFVGLALSACVRTPPPALDAATCMEEVQGLFGPQDVAVVAVRAADGGPLFRPEVLVALDGLCRAFEDAMVDAALRPKCLTSIPLMDRGSPRGELHTIRETEPLDLHTVARLQRLLLEVEFAVGDLVDPSLTRTFITLPRPSYEGVDLRALTASALATAGTTLTAALDDGTPEALAAFRRFSPDGASSSYIVGLYDSGKDGGLKEPEHLRALERFQVRAEGTPRVAETFAVTDDLKLVRRGLKKGLPHEGVLPVERSEAAQLLLALSLVPGAGDFGVRIDTAERVGLVRINLVAGEPEWKERTAARLDQILGQEAVPGARTLLCRAPVP